MKNKIALIYDFDKTLIPKNMQEYELQQHLGLENNFFAEFNDFAEKNNMDMVLATQYCFMQKAKEKNISLTKDFLKDCGRSLEYFDGVKDWFERINNYGKNLGLEIEHYVLSCGSKEIVDGCSIAKYFKRVFANEFLYDDKGVAVWPKILSNYTTKTQFVFRIRKNLLDNMYDVVDINKRSVADKIPFTNMIYIGDGFTDVPCMQIIYDKGGRAISVYAPNDERSMIEAQKLYEERRVSAVMSADYTEDRELDKYIKGELKKISTQLV